MNTKNMNLDLANLFFTKISNESESVFQNGNPFLLMACIHAGEEFDDQRNIIDEVSKKIGRRMQICVLDEDQNKFFLKKYEISGTPTYILFSDGEEKDRLLGKVDTAMLMQFIQSHLAGRDNQN